MGIAAYQPNSGLLKVVQTRFSTALWITLIAAYLLGELAYLTGKPAYLIGMPAYLFWHS